MPGASIFSCWASADHLPIRQIHVCTCLMSKPIKNPFFLLHTYTYNPRCEAACVCQLCLKHRFRMHGHPSHLFFLGKPALDTRIRWLNPEFYNQVLKFWIYTHIELRMYPYMFNFFCLIRIVYTMYGISV